MSHDPLQKVLDELSGASTTPLSEMRPLFGSEAYELIGYIRRLEIGIASPGLHRSMMERFAGENAELRQLLAVARKDRADILAVVDDAVTAGERMGNTLRSTETELKLAREAYSEIREIMAMQRERLAAAVARAEKAEAELVSCRMTLENHDCALRSMDRCLEKEKSAHLATQRALLRALSCEDDYDPWSGDDDATHGAACDAARAAVTQADHPRADAQKGGAL